MTEELELTWKENAIPGQETVYQRYGFHPDIGFLAQGDLWRSTAHPEPSPNQTWRDVVGEIPHWIGHPETDVRAEITEALKDQTLDLGTIKLDEHGHLTPAALQAFRGLSIIVSAYVFSGDEPAKNLPEFLAKPLQDVADICGGNPWVTYGSVILSNYREKDPENPTDFRNLDNISPEGFYVKRVFTLPRLDENANLWHDESWFYKIHLACEVAFANAIRECCDIMAEKDAPQTSARDTRIIQAFERTAKAINHAQKMQAMMLPTDPPSYYNAKMDDGKEKTVIRGCDQDVFYDHVRTFFDTTVVIEHEDIDPRTQQPKRGLILEGTRNEEPQIFPGASGAQGISLPFIDTIIGIKHDGSNTRGFTQRLRSSFPAKHQELIRLAEEQNLRDWVVEQGNQSMATAFNRVIEAISEFREAHIANIAEPYIFEPALARAISNVAESVDMPVEEFKRKNTAACQTIAKNLRSNILGTGGSKLTDFLTDMRTESEATAISTLEMHATRKNRGGDSLPSK